MNFNPIVRRQVGTAVAMTAAVVAVSYGATEHRRAEDMSSQFASSQAHLWQAMSQTNHDRFAHSEAADSDARGEMEAELAQSPIYRERVRDVMDSEEVLAKVRQAAREFIAESKPGAKVDGVFTLSISRESGLFIAGADATVDGNRRTIDLLVRKYARRNGGIYWRAESLGPDRAAALVDRAGVSATEAGISDEADPSR
ncbi:MAG: hypothetical protein H7Z41_13135 [Cytophagales bacterium]|nr:hypothetical protein [Armatimonadota bacterium]